MLLLIIALAVVVILGVVVLVRGGATLLPLGEVGDEVSDVTALKTAPRLSLPLLAKLVQGMKLSHQHDDLIIRDALVLLIRSYDQRGHDKLRSI
jgi:hypothetical protein